MSLKAPKELTGIDRAHLAVWLTEPSFKIVQELIEDEVNKYNLKLLDATKPEEVMMCHNYAKVAAQIYLGLVNRINNEVELYTKAPRATDKPVDMTESLDLDGLAEAMIDVPNLMEIE